MVKFDLYDEQMYMTIKKIIIRFLVIICIGYLAAFITAPLLNKSIYLIHTIMELFCIFTALSSFLIIWHSYKETLTIYRQLGFGLLSVSIFYSFHTYLAIDNHLKGQTMNTPAILFWVIGMLLESLVVFRMSLGRKELITNKWIKLFFILFFSFGASFILVQNADIFLAFSNVQGITAVKHTLDFIIILFCILSLHNLKYKIRGENDKTYTYLFIALLFVIASQLSFTKYDTIGGVFTNYAHILRLVCYYYFFKTIYVSSIEYPYKKLAESYFELEKANARIKEISSTLNDTLDAMPIGILKFEQDDRIRYMNRKLEEILACDRNDFYGMTFDELMATFPTIITDGDHKKLSRENAKKSKNAKISLKNLKNEDIKLSITSQSIGRGVLIYVNEVKVQQEIKSFHLQTETILNAVSNSVLIIDIHKKIILYNDAFRKLFEMGNLDISGMDLDEFNKIVGFKGKPLSEMLTATKVLEQPQEIPLSTLSGNSIRVLNYRAPIKNVDDEIIGAISICTDITEIKKHLHNMQQQEKLALIGQMAAGIVHEIKNPLATIKGLSQLISVKTQIDKVKEYSTVIDSAIDDITKVVNEFLSFAKPKPSVVSRTSINKIVESMQLITETQCYTKNIRSQFHYSSCPMEISADEIKIKQVMLNITENAIVALEDVPEPEIIIRTYYDTDCREGVIEIADNGIGMSPDVVAKLGTPFFTTKEKGTGLGLGISYEIMREHKGRIVVESEEGKGTKFKIVFTQIEDLL